uniref:2S albumin-like protein n=1 Tax=Picea glauca TaxID=3330 RepID=O81412_PICGL|nr:2S albumin-like protein [Picea glauca]
MGVFSPSTTRLTLKWFSLSVALFLLLHWGIPSVDGHEDNMYGEEIQQQRRSCDPQRDPQRLSSCRDYLERRREEPSERCCEELQRMSPQCRCQAIQQMLDQSLSYDSFMDSDSQEDAPLNQRRRRCREGRGREEEEAMERAAYLPNTCNVREPPRRCDIQRHSRYSMTGSSFK